MAFAPSEPLRCYLSQWGSGTLDLMAILPLLTADTQGDRVAIPVFQEIVQLIEAGCRFVRVEPEAEAEAELEADFSDFPGSVTDSDGFGELLTALLHSGPMPRHCRACGRILGIDALLEVRGAPDFAAAPLQPVRCWAFCAACVLRQAHVYPPADTQPAAPPPVATAAPSQPPDFQGHSDAHAGLASCPHVDGDHGNDSTDKESTDEDAHPSADSQPLPPPRPATPPKAAQQRTMQLTPTKARIADGLPESPHQPHKRGEASARPSPQSTVAAASRTRRGHRKRGSGRSRPPSPPAAGCDTTPNDTSAYFNGYGSAEDPKYQFHEDVSSDMTANFNGSASDPKHQSNTDAVSVMTASPAAGSASTEPSNA